MFGVLRTASPYIPHTTIVSGEPKIYQFGGKIYGFVLQVRYMRLPPLDILPHNRTGLVRAARIVSNIASPPSLFAAAGFVIALVEYPSLEGFLLAAIYGTLASLLPILYVVYLLKTNRISDLHMSDLRERRIPYLIGLIGAGFALWAVYTKAGPSLLTALILCHIIAMLTLTILNTYWLVSAHVATATALMTFAGFAFGYTRSLLLLPLVGIIFYVRWFLKRHTMGELVSGLFVGTGTVLLLATIGIFTR